MPTPSRNASAVVTASWPTIASMTKMISSGSTASRMSAACCIISASMPSRPAVSTMTMSVAARLACSIESRATCTGSPTPLPGSGAYTSTPARAAEHLELVDRVRALQVGGDQQRLVALALEPAGQLAGQRRLTGTLQTGQHDHGRRLLGELQPPAPRRRGRDQLLVDDLDDLLGRVERLGDLGAARPLLEVGDERLDHGQRDVRLQQREPDLARGGVDVGVGEPALAAELGEDPGEAVTQGVKHPAKTSVRAVCRVVTCASGRSSRPPRCAAASGCRGQD